MANERVAKIKATIRKKGMEHLDTDKDDRLEVSDLYDGSLTPAGKKVVIALAVVVALLAYLYFR